MTDSQLNILLFSGRFEVRGSSAYTLRLAEHLGEYGVTPHVVTPDARLVKPNLRAALSLSEYSHIDFPLWGRAIRHWMRRDLARRKLDLVHVQSSSVLKTGTWLARRLGLPMIVTVHDFLPQYERVRFDSTVGRRIVAVSESVRQDILKRLNVSPATVAVIHSGVDIANAAAGQAVLDPGHAPVVGTAGPLESLKGLHFFLGAAQKVLARRSNVEFLVSGAGPEEGNLRRLARELGITEHVTFLSNLLDFSTAFAAMDIFCLPSLQQGLGTIMLEAMALGKPVIATSVGGVHTVVRNNETGLLVPPSSSAALAEKIVELLDDPIRARRIGDAGRSKVLAEFGVDRMVCRTVELYREVLNESRGASAGHPHNGRESQKLAASGPSTPSLP